MRDQPRGRGVKLGRVRGRVSHDRRQARGELLAEFDAPLVERIDVPDRAFA